MPTSHSPRRPRRRLLAGALALAASCLAFGCGGQGNHISGTVTFNKQPVPRGRVYFVPDLAKKNDGVAGYADVKDGRYDTRDSGKGHVGGAVLVRIEGFDGKATEYAPLGQALFNPYETPVELPADTTTKDFDVPATAAAGLERNVGPPP